MSIEREQPAKPILDKYHNDDYIKQVFAGDDENEIEKLRRVHSLTHEQIDVFTHYAKMRQGVIESKLSESRKRKDEHPAASADELMIACYLEDIEPQVRGAVVKMNKKGYATRYSGFHNLNSQAVKFTTDKEVDINLEQVEERHKDNGVKIKTDREAIEIIFSKKISLEEIKQIWDEIAEALPDLGGRAKAGEALRQWFIKRQESVIKRKGKNIN